MTVRALRLAVLVLLLAGSGAALATTMAGLTTAQLFAKADVVAVVQVRDVQTNRVGGRLVTGVTVEVSEPFKGIATGSGLKILTLGGSDGRLGQRVEGAAQFSQGETSLVFLRRVAQGVYHVVGMEQGKLSLETDSNGALQLRRGQSAHVVTHAAGGGWQDALLPPQVEPAEPFFAELRHLGGGIR